MGSSLLRPSPLPSLLSKASSPHLRVAKLYWKSHLRPGDIAIDATCGNGQDTLYLSELLLFDPSSEIVALDIQPEAIQNTRQLLQASLPSDQFQKVSLYKKSHEEIGTLSLRYSPRLIVYNLGYLPGGNKEKTTKTESTLQSVQRSLELLSDDGALSITCYPGHLEGAKEEAALLEFVKTLPFSSWRVCHHSWINKDKAPSFLWISRAAAMI